MVFKYHYYKALTIIKKYHYVTNNGMNSKLLRIDRKLMYKVLCMYAQTVQNYSVLPILWKCYMMNSHY